MQTNWIAKQSLCGIVQFDQAMSSAYPESEGHLHSGRKYLETIDGVCNYMVAAEQLSWATYLPTDAKVLDIGCGGGWLSAMLTRFDAVQTVYALDSSNHFLHAMLPQVMELMGGCKEKLVPIEGLFEPLLFEDGYLDFAVASSALHHADNLESVLREVRRCLKPRGMLLVINETPRLGYRHWLSVFVAAFRILRDLALQKYRTTSPAISSSCYLYDPKLGDRDYPLWYWRKAIEAAGFSLESVVDTGLPTVKTSKGRPLIHFVCRAV
jgi:SAM-dependent methyltransferase